MGRPSRNVDHERGLAQCTKCGEWKPPDQFYTMRSNPWGMTPDCKDCRRKYQKVYYKNRELRKFERSMERKYGPPPEA
jgi:NAD-dependent SIR2 family protein deacetylase